MSVLANLYFLLANHPHCCPPCLEEPLGVNWGQVVVHGKQLERSAQLTLVSPWEVFKGGGAEGADSGRRQGMLGWKEQLGRRERDQPEVQNQRLRPGRTVKERAKAHKQRESDRACPQERE